MTTITIEEFIRKTYESYPKPLYLSTLGGLLKKNGYTVLDLKKYIDNLEGFVVAQGSEPKTARVAIAAIDELDWIRKLLDEDANKPTRESVKYLSSLPRKILYAFCSKTKATGSIFLQKQPPYDYDFTENDSFIEVSKELLIDAKVPANLKQMPDEIIEQLAKNIDKWLNDNNIEIAKSEPKQNKFANEDSLLHQLLQAIPTDQRHRVSLPLDIIGHLLKDR